MASGTRRRRTQHACETRRATKSRKQGDDVEELEREADEHLDDDIAIQSQDRRMDRRCSRCIA